MNMNHHRTEARASLNELSAAIVRLAVKCDDPELLFLGTALSTILRAAADENEREELDGLIRGYAVRRLMKAAGASDLDLLVMDRIGNSMPN